MRRTRERSSRATSLLALAALLAACGDEEPDAYGNFEAREVVVSAEVGGQLLEFAPDEGDRLAAGQTVGRIDAAALILQKEELLSQQRAARTRTSEAEAQIDVLEAQLAMARDEYARTRRLYQVEAATARQLNRAEGEVRVLQERIEAARAQASAATEETAGVQARIAQIEEQLRKSRITNPITGTVLTTYVAPGELVQRGAPLYEIADLRTLTLRAYVSGAQLAGIRIGEPVEVRVDAGEDELLAFRGRITWIASEAEFTPTPIQTREERTDQVYAIRVRVPNAAGALKIGMPGEVYFTERDDVGAGQALAPDAGARQRRQP